MNQDNVCIGYCKHQVGGHHCIISYEGCILKPYNENEASMYHLIPRKYPHLTPFLSEFYGIVHFVDSEMGAFQTMTELSLEILKDTTLAFSRLNKSTNGYSIDQREEWLKTLFFKRFNRKHTSNSLK
jgi:hypothetical protein